MRKRREKDVIISSSSHQNLVFASLLAKPKKNRIDPKPIFYLLSVLRNEPEDDLQGHRLARRLLSNKSFLGAVATLRKDLQIDCKNNWSSLREIISQWREAMNRRNKAREHYEKLLARQGFSLEPPSSSSPKARFIKTRPDWNKMDIQRRALKKSGFGKVREETAIVATRLEKLLNQLQTGDIQSLLEKFELPNHWEWEIERYVLLDKLYGLKEADLPTIRPELERGNLVLRMDIPATATYPDIKRALAFSGVDFMQQYLQGAHWKGKRKLQKPELRKKVSELSAQGKTAQEILDTLADQDWDTNGITVDSIRKMLQRIRRPGH